MKSRLFLLTLCLSILTVFTYTSCSSDNMYEEGGVVKGTEKMRSSTSYRSDISVSSDSVSARSTSSPPDPDSDGKGEGGGNGGSGGGPKSIIILPSDSIQISQ